VEFRGNEFLEVGLAGGGFIFLIEWLQIQAGEDVLARHLRNDFWVEVAAKTTLAYFGENSLIILIGASSFERAAIL
jgi:hypothetical protein